MRSGVLLVFALSASAIAACSSSAEDAPAASGDATPTTVVKEDPTDIPLRTASAAERSLFVDGDIRFDEPFRDTDGVGPVYIRTACGACHEAAGKGPGTVVKMVVIDADGVTPAKDQSLLPYGNTVRPYTAGAATTALLAPETPQVKQTTRVPPAVFGRGYIEAVDDAEIERVEAEQKARTDGIHGQIHRVTYPSETSADEAFHTHKKGDGNLIGRFGLKARQATLDDFTADAYQGDMGITSPLRPTELPNPDNLTDDSKPGVDIDVETVRLVARYMRLLEIPRRKPTAGSPGEKLFADSKCAVCHVPTMKTRASYPIAPLAGIDAPVFTDLLLHDLGPAMSDGLTDGGAGPSQWKTAPLIGLRFMRNYLHDGRARTVEAAILGHEGTGSEANASISLFRALSDADRATLVEYVEGLLPASSARDREPVARRHRPRARSVASRPYRAPPPGDTICIPYPLFEVPMRIARTFASVFALSVLVASVGCSDSSEDAPAAATADHEKEATAAVKKYIDENLTALNAAALELQAAAPAPDADGWNAQADAASVEAMRKAWYKARVAYEHIEGAIAVLFPEIDVSTDERYDAFVLDSPDDDLFDDQGVTGIHGIERILWSNQIPQVVIDFESKLKGPGGASVYKKAAFPANEAEARAFKEKLCGRLVADTKKMQTEFAPLALDLSAAYRGVVGSMREQVEKVKKAASGEEESRYAQYTGADLRANVEGGKVIYGAFRPWVLDRGAEGKHIDGEIMDAFARVEAAYATIPGDALPPVPATWSQTPTEADLATPFGKIYKVLVTESDEKTDGSLVHDMNEAAALIALPEQ